jgi:hypothetical protein
MNERHRIPRPTKIGHLLCRDNERKPFPEKLGRSPRAHGRKQTDGKRLFIEIFSAAICERNQEQRNRRGVGYTVAGGPVKEAFAFHSSARRRAST